MRALMVVLGALAVSCQSQEQAFTQGRLESLCDGAVPVCRVRAACVLGDDAFVERTFPGAQRLIVRSEVVDQTLVLRLLLFDQVFPGTELLVQLNAPGCGALEEERLLDVDIFRRAGDDRVLEFELPMGEKGDHLLEIFSDMSAGYLLTVDVEG